MSHRRFVFAWRLAVCWYKGYSCLEICCWKFAVSGRVAAAGRIADAGRAAIARRSAVLGGLLLLGGLL
jgi:hypothetical protein